MKTSLSLIAVTFTGASAFTPLSISRQSTVLKYSMDEYQRQMQSMMNPAPAAPPAPVAPPAYAPPAEAPAAYAPPAPAAPPAYASPPVPAQPPAPAQPPIQETEGTAGMGWAAAVNYNPDEDVFPVFPPHYKTFDQIWAEFQAAKAAGKIR
jgi:hypothetical protein